MLYNPKTDLGAAGKRLLRAADILDRKGWCQYENEDAWGHICAEQAINEAINEAGDSNAEAFPRMQSYLGMVINKWNDQICDTKEQAVQALRDAAWMDKISSKEQAVRAIRACDSHK